MSLSVASMQDFFFEVSDQNSVFNTTGVTQYQLTVNRVSQNNGTNDFVSSKHVSATSEGKLPKTQISINIPEGTTDLNAYFDASFSITVTSLEGSTAKQTETTLAKYVLPPQSDTIGNIIVNTEQNRIIVKADLNDASFNISGLTYHIQIDGLNEHSNYVSRNIYEPHDGSGNLSWDSSGVFSDASNNLIMNGKWYDVAVIAFNSTGSTGVVENVYTVNVSQDANTPVGSTVDSLYNSENSDGRVYLNLKSADTFVSNDPDRSYKIEVSRSDASNVILNTYFVDASYSLDGSGTIDANYDVSYIVTGLTPDLSYNIYVSAKNSTSNYSAPKVFEGQIPEAVPEGLKITAIRRGLYANETDPSGKLMVRLDIANYKDNGQNVSLKYLVKGYTGLELSSEIYNDFNYPSTGLRDVSFETPFYGYSGELIENAFIIENLENNKFHMVGVYAQNTDAEGLKAQWWGLNGEGNVNINDLNTPKPITHPDAPIFDNNTDSSGVHPIYLEESDLLSGQVRGTIVLPVYEDVSGNVPEYTQYKMFVEDLSGQDIPGKSVTVDITKSQYLELGTKFTHVDGSSVIVSTKDSLIGYGQYSAEVYSVGGDIQEQPKHAQFVADPSWSITQQDAIWLDASASTQYNDASFSQTFSGLEDGKKYVIKAQLVLDSLESSIMAASKQVVPSSKPQLDSNLGNKVAGIFDVSGGTILDTDTDNVSFTSKGVKELLVGSTNGGYDISGLIVAFVYSYQNALLETVKEIHEQYIVDASDGTVDASYNFNIGSNMVDLSGARTYSVYVTPQNSVYNDGSYNSFAELEAVPGSVILNSLKLDSKILDISSAAIKIDPSNSTVIKIDGQLEQGNGNMTVLKRIEGKLTAIPEQWDGDSWETLDGCYNQVTNFELTLNNGVDANGVFTKTFTVDKSKYGWQHQVVMNVISGPNDSAFGSVDYSSQGVSQGNLVAGKKPTIILEDVSNVTILPNGFYTTVTLIDLSGNELATIDPIAGGDTANDNEVMNVRYNTFYDASHILVSLDDTDSNYAVVDGIKNTYQINDAVNLQTSAHNAKGRSTLFSEKTFTVVVESGNATLVASDNDGKFVLRPSTTGDITFRLDIA